MTLTPNDYQRGFNDGVAAATTPDPRVTQLVEAAREVMRAYDESSGNEPSISVLMRLIGTDFRTALKAMEQSDD